MGIGKIGHHNGREVWPKTRLNMLHGQGTETVPKNGERQSGCPYLEEIGHSDKIST